jgi:CO/xanthine dehydrogenase Mo-binding subunit
MESTNDLKVAGKSLARVDGKDKATGKAVYTVDIELPNMAIGKILRSPFPHAKLVKINAEKAAKLPGVVAVITRDDLSSLNYYYGAAYKDQPIVAVDVVRFVGDPVAGVAAVDAATAEEALGLIEVEYEELPAVDDLEGALKSGAPIVHESVAEGGELHGYHYQTPEKFKGTNICYQFSYKRGDVAEGFKSSDHVFEHTFTFPRVQHYSMEPHAIIANVESDRITLWASSQDPFTLREHLAEIFHLPLSRVRVIVPYVGGGYGGKLSVKPEPLAAALSWKAGRPVKIVLSVEESFKTVTRHPARFRIKTGVTRDGRLLARECEIYMDTGAYADAGPRVTQKAGYRAFGPYKIPNVKSDAYTVYTNTAPAGAFRGFGTLQVTWAYESQMDIIAEKLGIDALEFRLKNLLNKGDLYTTGDTPVDCDLREGLLRAAREIAWGEKGPPGTGKGLSCCMKDGGGTYKFASAAAKMISDGSVVLLTGTVELGQGAQTALSQVVAEELSLPLEHIVVAQLDTDTTPYDPGTNASSSMVVMGLCVQRAAQDLKRQLLDSAAKALNEDAVNLSLEGGHVESRSGKKISYPAVIAKFFGANAGELIGKGSYQDIKSAEAALGSPTTFWEIGWGGAKVAVNRDTGEIDLLKYVSIADVGQAIHPVQCEGQDEGAVMFAVGHTLREEMVYKDGQLLNPNLIDYRVPNFLDVPKDFKTILMESHNGPGPFGSKGMGEGGLLPVASAVANAVYNAVGVRLYDLPLTAERVWRALKEKKSA